MRRIYLLFDAHIMKFENSADRPTGRLLATLADYMVGLAWSIIYMNFWIQGCFDQFFDVLYAYH